MSSKKDIFASLGLGEEWSKLFDAQKHVGDFAAKMKAQGSKGHLDNNFKVANPKQLKVKAAIFGEDDIASEIDFINNFDDSDETQLEESNKKEKDQDEQDN